jgi:hypothetical protein
MFTQRNQTNRHYTIFSDSQAALPRCSHDKPGPGQDQAHDIMDREKGLKLNKCMVMLRWVPGHKGVPGNEQANAMAKRAAKELPEDAYCRWITRTASLTYLRRKTTETRTKATKEWIETRTAKSKAYIPRKQMGLRKNLCHEKKEVASRFYQLLSGHAITAPYLKEKLRKSETDTCWWCESGKKQTRDHLFKECSMWKTEIRDLWKMVGREVGWRRAKWKPISKLFAEEKAEKAILEFIKKRGVGKKNGTREPRINVELDAEERGVIY